MTSQPHHRAIAPLRRIIHVAALLVATTATVAWAHGDDLPPCADGLPPGTTMPDPTWRTVVAVDHGFALRLPAGHVLAGSDGAWYVHGVLDGAPLVPDVAIAFLTGVTIADAVAHDVPAGTTVERIRLGPATTGARVDAAYIAPDGSSYRQTSYLAETEHGVLRVDRYEGFDWDGFDAVACSVHVVELVE